MQSVIISYKRLGQVLGQDKAFNLSCVVRETGSALLPSGAKLYVDNHDGTTWHVSGYAHDGSDVAMFQPSDVPAPVDFGN